MGMAETGALREKVLTYLSGLSPNARAMLVRNLERGDGTAMLDPRAKIILDVARTIERLPSEAPPLVLKGDMKSRFSAPFSAFIINETLEPHKNGWISRPSLEAIWTFLGREVLPAVFDVMNAPIDQLGYHSEQEADTAAELLRRQASEALTPILAAADKDPKARQRLVARLGGENTLADLRGWLALLPRIAALDHFLSRLPASISNTEAAERLVTEPLQGYLKSNPQDTTFVATGLVSRLVTAASLARYAVILTGDADTASLRKSPYATFIDVALSSAERIVLRFASRCRQIGTVDAQVADLKAYHELIRSTSTTVQLDNDPTWRNRLTNIRRKMSDAVSAEIEDVSVLARRALKLDDRIVPGETEGQDARRAVTLFVCARRCRETLAVNELLNRVGNTTEQTVEIYGRDVLDRLRHDNDKDRPKIIIISDYLIAMSEQLFGEEHASLLRRGRDKAIGR
jgi:hypothetical protein